MQAIRMTTRLQGWGIAILRVVTGYLFLASGVHKLFFLDLISEPSSSVPEPILVLGSLGEFVCGAALVVGLLTRWLSIPLAILMLADIVVFHPPYELFS